MVAATNYRTSLKGTLQETPAIPRQVLRIQRDPVLSIQQDLVQALEAAVQDRLLRIPPAVPVLRRVPALHRTLRQELHGQNKFVSPAKVDPGDLCGLGCTTFDRAFRAAATITCSILLHSAKRIHSEPETA